MEQSRIYTEWFYNNKLEELREKFSEEMKNALSLNDLGTFRTQITVQLGIEIEILDERVYSLAEYQIYERVARYDNYHGPIQVQWTLGQSNIIYGFFIRPVPTEAPSDYLEYQTKVNLRLPFDDLWTVVWGGRSIEDNYHAAYSDQRFAYDLLIINNGLSHSGDGSNNEDYYCFGKQLFAPGDGVVVASIDTVHDNSPGEMNPIQALGNYVIIDHGNDEYSFMVKLKKESIVVEVDDSLKAGQFIGLTGNSGNSSEPHLHYHLQNTAIFIQGEGLPAQFQNYIADGIEVSRGEPIRGQKVRNK